MNTQLRTILAAILFFVVPSLKAQSVSWEKLPSLPEESGNLICGTIGEDIAILGGISWKNETKFWLDTMWRYDSGKKTWSELGKLPQPIAYAAFGQTKSGIYFAGGSDGEKMHSDFYSLDTKLNLKKIGGISQPRMYSGSAISGSKLFVVAGATDPADLRTLTNSFYSIDLRSGKTETLPAFPGGKWMIPTAAAIDGKIFVFTGAYQDGTNNSVINSDSAFVYNISARSWKKIKPYPVPVRGLASCALDNRYVLLGGGYTNEFTDLAFIYDTKADTYLKTESLPYRAMANLVQADEYIYWLGGEDKMRHRTDLCYRVRWKNLLNTSLRENRP